MPAENQNCCLFRCEIIIKIYDVADYTHLAYSVMEGGVKMTELSKSCTLYIGSVTQAMRAQEALRRAAIPTYVIKGERGEGGTRGCIYGLSYYCTQRENIKTVLSYEKIRVKKWTEES